MSEISIFDLNPSSNVNGSNVFPSVDVSDTTESPEGSTRKFTWTTHKNWIASQLGTYQAVAAAASTGSLVPSINSGDSTLFLNSLGEWAVPAAGASYTVMGVGNGYAAGLVQGGQAYTPPTPHQTNGKYLGVHGEWINPIVHQDVVTLSNNAALAELTDTGVGTISSTGDAGVIETWLTSDGSIILNFSFLIALTKDASVTAWRITYDLGSQIWTGQTYGVDIPATQTYHPVVAIPENFPPTTFLPVFSGHASIQNTTLIVDLGDVISTGTTLNDDTYRVAGTIVGRFS